MGGVISKVNRILNAKSTSVFMFGFTGTYKVFTDYKRAPESEKKNVLLKDTFILAGSATGLTAYTIGRNNLPSVNSNLTIQVFSLIIVETLSRDLIIIETLIFASLGKVVGIS